MDKLNFFNSIGHYVLLFMLIYQSKYFFRFLRKIRDKREDKLPARNLDEVIAREIFISNLKG